jgi:hypothetical protein
MDELGEVPLLVLQPEAILESPHRGTQIRQTFAELVGYFRRPFVSPSKDTHGGIALGQFRNGVRRGSHFENTRALGIDYDAGAIASRDIFEAIGPCRHFTCPTHGSVRDFHKSRSILFLDRAIDGPAFKRCMRVVQTIFFRAGIALDKSAVDATRWWFCPVVRPEMADAYQVHYTPEDAPLFSVAKLLAHADRLDAEDEAARQEYRRSHPAPELTQDETRDRYVRGAVRRAADRVANASEGERHFALNAEAYSLARLGLSEGEIMDALLVPFVIAAGEPRKREAERTIRDACRARGAA